ncbi:hypothetical protein LY76DRAFT_212582 [Colletotrichum caudatum]|nr:hypothetical protein LY76DRAFT_212582 [Colletotrichum caudatum]
MIDGRSPSLTYSPKSTLPPNLYCYLQSIDTPWVNQVRSTDCIYHHLNYSLFLFLCFFLYFKISLWTFAENRRYKAQLRGWQMLPGHFSTHGSSWDTRDRQGRGTPASGIGAKGHVWLIHAPSSLLSSWWERRSGRYVKLCMYAGMCHMLKSLVLHERWKAGTRWPFFFVVSGRMELTTVEKSLYLHRISSLVCVCVDVCSRGVEGDECLGPASLRKPMSAQD